MGHVWVRARIGDEDRIKLIDADALVIPRKIALNLNLKPTGKSIVETGAGRMELER